MAELNFSSKPYGKKKYLHKSARVDLTPMVDLGFLLITFFIITTTMQELKAMRLILPKDSTDSTILNASTTLTFILKREDSINYYEVSPISLKTIGFGSMRSIIQQKQLSLENKNIDKAKLTIIIKPANESSYKNFIDAIDEITINNVRHYFVAEAGIEEL